MSVVCLFLHRYLINLTIKHLLKNDLRLKPLKITCSDKQNGVQKCIALLRMHTPAAAKRIIFSDIWYKPCRHQSSCQEDQTCIISCENHGLGAMSGYGKLELKIVTPVRVNKDYHINGVLTHVLLPQVNGLYPNGDWIFQQDGATTHTQCYAVLIGMSLP